MTSLSGSATIDRVMNNVGDTMTPDFARRIVALQPDPELDERLDYLSARSEAGELTEEERAEYESVILMGDLISLMKRRAKRILNSLPSSK